MKASEFTEQARAALHAQGLAAFAQELVEAGVLEADDNPRPRRVEVEGIVVQADEDGDLDVFIDEELTFTLIDDEVPRAAPLARALLAWVAASEPQEQPQAAPPKGETWRERSGEIEFLVTRDKGVAAGGRQLCFRDHSDEPLVAFGDRQAGGHPWIEGDSYRVISRAALAELAAHFCPPQPQPAPEPTQGTRERPFIWRRRTESGGTEEVPVWLEQAGFSVYLLIGGPGACNVLRLRDGSARPSRMGAAIHYPGPKDAHDRALFEGDDLPQPAAQPQPEAGDVVLRLTREEAEAVCFALGKLKPGPTLEVYAKLDELLDGEWSEREDKFRWEGSGAVIRRR